MRQAELNDLYDQAVRHALIAERMGFPGTAEALWVLARELEAEREEMLDSNPLALWAVAPKEGVAPEPQVVRLRVRADG